MKYTSIDRLHPAVCFGFFLAAIVMSMILRHPAYLGAGLLGALLLNISISGGRALKKAALYLPLAFTVAVINPLFNTLGETVLFCCWGRPYTLEALLYGLTMGTMLLSMLLWFSAYNTVMTDDKFSYLFGTLSPSLSLLLTTVLRMIPHLAGKLRQILSARRCIGMAGGDSGKEKLFSGVTAISVLTSWALEGSVTAADSMNSRGYGTGERSCFHSYRFTAGDRLISAVLAALLVCTLVFLLWKGAPAEFTPVLRIAPVHPGGLTAYLIFLLMPTFLNWNEELKWRILKSKI